MLVGVALESVANPPQRDKAKSDISRVPLPPVELYTASEKVTIMLVLSADIEVPLIYRVCEKTVFDSKKVVKIILFKYKLSTKIHYLITP